MAKRTVAACLLLPITENVLAAMAYNIKYVLHPL